MRVEGDFMDNLSSLLAITVKNPAVDWETRDRVGSATFREQKHLHR